MLPHHPSPESRGCEGMVGGMGLERKGKAEARGVWGSMQKHLDLQSAEGRRLEAQNKYKAMAGAQSEQGPESRV